MYISKKLIAWADEMGRRVAKQLNRAMPNIFDYTNPRLFLRDSYQAKRLHDSSFSHRHICNRLGVKSIAVFQHYITGRNKIPDRHIPVLAAAFKLKKKEAEYFDLLVHFDQAAKPEDRRDRLSELSGFLHTNKNLVKPRQYAYYEQWYHSALRACMSYYKFSGDHGELASLLSPPVTAVEARNSLRLMERLGLLKRDTDDVLRPADQIISTGDQATSVAFGKHLIQMLELARRAIDEVPRDQREMSSITLSLSKESLENVRKEITKCRYRVLELVRKDPNPDRVYQASFQIFPLTGEKKKRHASAS